MSGPESPYESQDQAFFAAVGRLTLAWGLIDAALGVFIQVIHNRFEGETKIEADLPWNLDKKVRYVRKCVFRLELFKPTAKTILPLMDDVTRECQFRHDIVHGLLVSIPAVGQATKLARFLPKRGIKTLTVTTAEIEQNATSARSLGGRLLNIALGTGQFAEDHRY